MMCLTTPCPQEPNCPTPANCATRGSCLVVASGTCAQCNPGYILVSDPTTGFGTSCKAKEFQSCDVCNSGSSATCPTGTSCCCGTCREACVFLCALKCAPPGEQPLPKPIEVSIVRTTHFVKAPCESPEIAHVEELLAATVTDILGAWNQVGKSEFNHQCTNNMNIKRQQATSSTINSEIVLTGPAASEQAATVASNLPPDSAANGVSASLVSASSETQSDAGGLSDGAIAGIVIGSVAAAVLVVIAIALALGPSSKPEMA